MISDEQIQEIFKRHCCYIDADMSLMRAVRELIALAQQVKDLEWSGTTEIGVVAGYWKRRNTGWYAATAFGIYFLYETDFDYRVKLVEMPNDSTEIIAHRINEMDNAKAAANADYRQRVLSCLVWGGV